MPHTKIKLSKDKIDKIIEICKSFSNEAGELINVLHAAQGEFGFLPPEVQEVIANELNIPVAKVYGVVTFYSFFSMKQKGNHAISICTGTACHVRGATAVLEEFKRILNINIGETTEDGNFSLSTLRCVGACGLAPVVLVDEKVYGRVSIEEVKNIISEHNLKINI
jgi:NADH-quinone oxidoreductase subunit E/NADP-reducing hydrogenase subunit HndA